MANDTYNDYDDDSADGDPGETREEYDSEEESAPPKRKSGIPQ